MAKFKVGDRVISIAPVGHEGVTGAYGEIVAIDSNDYRLFLVKFDQHIGGHDGYGECNERGWWCASSDIKLVFDHTKYIHGRYAMHTKTLEEAKLFEKYMRYNGGRPASSDNWDVYMEDTCFNINACSYMNVSWYKDAGYTILEFEDFDWSDFDMKKEFTRKDLKNGDVVLRRNGNVDVVILDIDCLLNDESGGYKVSNIKDDLTHTHNSDYDIIAVRRFDDPEMISFDAFDDKDGKLVYERKEVEEMTLEEVCKALGKEIKIVKEK